MKKLSGIYCFVNKVNGKKYIGQAQDIFDRRKQHKYRFSNLRDTGYRSAFHSALRKYGWENFDFYILQLCDIKDLDRKEEHWIRRLNTLCPNGYNIILRACQSRKIKEISRQNQAPVKKEARLSSKDIDLNLINDILVSSFEAVARKYGYTSGNAIKKRLQANGLPYKKKELFEYWENITNSPHPVVIAKRKREKEKMLWNKKYAPKQVFQISIDTKEIIACFPSTKEAQRCTGINSGQISECAREKITQAGGYLWQYTAEV